MQRSFASDTHLVRFRDTGDVSILEHRVSELSRAASTADDPETIASYAQALAAKIMANTTLGPYSASDSDVAELRAAVFKLRNLAPAASLSLLVEGLLSVVRLATARDRAEVGKHHVRAQRYLENAFRSDPDDPEIQLAIGQFKLRTPPEGGPQAKEGEALLRRLARDPRYTGAVARLGIETA